MSIELATRVTQIKPSATIAVNTRAAELRDAGQDIINLSVGEPDFDTPEPIKEACYQSIAEGFTKYTAIDGIVPLKQAIIEKLIRDNDLHYQPDEIIVSNGVKQGVYNLCLSILNPGDEVIIASPYWVSYPAIAKLAGATPVIVRCDIDQKFKMRPEQLAASITAKTKLLMLNSPSNPTGIAYSNDELAAFAEILKEHPKVVILSDDIYEYILWGVHRFDNILNACPELTQRTFVMNGVSKSYAMTGWRIGYTAGPKPVIQAMKKIQSQSTSNPCSFAQAAAVVAINSKKELIKPMLEAFKRRHDFVYNALSAIKDLNVIPADGTFYLFPDVKVIINRLGLTDDVAFAEYLLNKANIAVVPGTAFGMPGYIRISSATSDENLEIAMERFAKVLK